MFTGDIRLHFYLYGDALMAEIIKVSAPFLLGNIPEYHSDELMYTYLTRVAVANGFESADEFFKYAVCEKDDVRKFYNRIYLNFDCMKREADCLEFQDDYNWLISGTLFKGIAPLQTEEESHYRLKEYYNNRLLKITPGHVNQAITALRLCPECMEEEGNDWYYHTNHQMPFVSYCPIHGCPLMWVNTGKGNIISTPTLEKIPEKPMDKYLSDFSCSLFDHDLKCCGDDLLKVLKKRIGNTPYRIRQTMEKNIQKKELLSRMASVCLENIVNDDIAPPVTQFILFLAYYFDDIEEIEKDLSASRTSKTAFMKAIRKRYELLGEFRPDVVHVRCLHCGAVFFISPTAVVYEDERCYECAS